MANTKRGFLVLVAVGVTIGALWFFNRSVPPKTATWEDVIAESERSGYSLISTAALWESYRKNPESYLIVDTRQEWEFRSGHISGAVNFPMEPTWRSRWQKKRILEVMLGTDKNRAIVFY